MTNTPRLSVDKAALRLARLHARFSQADLADKAKVNINTIKAWEAGRYPSVQPATVRKVAKALKVAPESITRVVPSEEPEEAAS